MRQFVGFWIVIAALGAIGCGGGSTGTPVAGSNAVHAKLVASGFDNPMLYVAHPSDKTLAYVLERAGRIRVLVSDVLQSAPVLDITGLVVTDGECGLLGMTFDPNFASNHYFYLHYDSGSPLQSLIVRFTMDPSGKSAGGAFPILTFTQTGFTNHKGGALNFGPDGYLYLAFGDGGSGNDPNNYAQDPTVFFGKMLRIDPSGDDFPADPNNNYAIPPTNPWAGIAGVRGEIWDFGLRNPFRWSFDSLTGGILIADVGQDAYEEVNFELAGTGHKNYGWRTREGKHPTSNGGPVFFTPLTDPFFDYSHATGQCVIGGFVYHGAALPSSVRGRYFFGDYTTGKIFSIPLRLTPGVGAQSITLTSAFEHTGAIDASLGGAGLSGPVSLTPDANGEIIVCDLNNGNLIRLVK